MNFLFFDAANHVLFTRSDAEQAEHCHEEMSLHCLFPCDSGKMIERGMRIGYTDSLGVFQCFEIRQCRNYEPDHYQEITAEHIVISELTDEHFPGKDWTDVTAASALADILTGTLWSVGNVTASNTSSANSSMGNVWQDVRTIENNWNVYITPRVVVNASGIVGRYLDIAPAGGTWRGLRLSLEKNMDDASVTWDDTRLKTALYGYGKSVAVSGQDQNQPLTFADVVWTETADHPAKPAGQKYLEDPAATAAYGRNGRPRFGFYQNGDIADAETLLQKTWETLKTVSVPDVSIDGVVRDLYRLGFTDVPIRLHDTAIVEIRPTGVNLQKEIIKYTEDLLNPQSSRLNIGAYIPNIIYINRENAARSGAGGGSGGQSNNEYKLEEFYTQIEGNSQELRLKAAQRDMTNVENILMESGVAISAQGTIIYANNNLNDIKASINTQADRISLVVEGTGANAHIKPASIVTAINNQTGQSLVLLEADIIDIAGIVSRLDSYDIGCENLIVNDRGSFGQITCEDTITAQQAMTAPDFVLSDNSASVSEAVADFGTPTASGGQISIPWTKLDGTAGTPINFNIADTQFYQDGVSAAAAGVTLSGSWTGRTFTVTASNGRDYSETLQESTGIGYGANDSILIDTFSASHFAFARVLQSSAQGGNILYGFKIDASGVFADGQASGAAGVTVDSFTWTGLDTNSYNTIQAAASNGATNSLTVYMSQGAWASGAKTVYIRTGSTSGTIRARTSVAMPTDATWRWDYPAQGYIRANVTIGGKLYQNTHAI